MILGSYCSEALDSRDNKKSDFYRFFYCITGMRKGVDEYERGGKRIAEIFDYYPDKCSFIVGRCNLNAIPQYIKE
jgi:hypothetical protein